MSILDDPALDVHVGLANRKRVDVVGIKVTKTVIDEAVGGFVGADGIQDVLHRRVLGKAPVIFGDGRRRHLLPVFNKKNCLFFSPNRVLGPTSCYVPLGETALLELFNCMRIRQHGLFLEVTDETVAGPR